MRQVGAKRNLVARQDKTRQGKAKQGKSLIGLMLLSSYELLFVGQHKNGTELYYLRYYLPRYP